MIHMCLFVDKDKFLKKTFYYLLTGICLANAFYLPDYFSDRFFTSGMIWVGLVVPVFFVLFLFIERKRIFVPIIWLYFVGIMALGGFYAAMTGTFSWQHTTYTGALCLLMLMMVHSEEVFDFQEIYFVVTAFAGLEALLGIAQYFRWYEVYNFNFPVTGTFDNPAGLGIILAVCFPLGFSFMFGKSCKLKWWGGIISCLLLVAVFLSGSRTGLIALVVVGCMFLGVRLHVCRVWKRRLAIAMGIGGVGLLLCLYFLKKDSADGRLLIWRCTAEMVSDAPLIGHGPGSFGGKYMLYQARFLAEYSDDRQTWLADNVKHPFNEYLKIIVEYGMTGLILLIITMVWLFWKKRYAPPEEQPLFLSLVALAICCLFSYPLNYPSVCILLSLILGVAIRSQKTGVLIYKWQRWPFLVLGVGIFVFSFHWKNVETRWYRLIRLSSSNNEEILDGYREIYPFMCENPLFLYNYGAELHARKYWNESCLVLEKTLRQLNDTDVQFIMAENYLNMEDCRRAEYHFLLASKMCPNRFLPLYRLVKLYDCSGHRNEACLFAQQILDKPVKISSCVIEKIRNEMKEYLEQNSGR